MSYNPGAMTPHDPAMPPISWKHAAGILGIFITLTGVVACVLLLIVFLAAARAAGAPSAHAADEFPEVWAALAFCGVFLVGIAGALRALFLRRDAGRSDTAAVAYGEMFRGVLVKSVGSWALLLVLVIVAMA